MKKLVIAGSSKFLDEIEKKKEFFENQGYNVINYPKKINPGNEEEYKKAHTNFFESLNETDILFVLNQDKNGIEGYIGAETFAELSYTVVQNTVNGTNKKIYLFKMPSKEVACYMEIKNFIKLGWIEICNKNKEK